MALYVNTNMSALNAFNNLSKTQGDLSKSLERLSSGLRINRAGDDAAGLAISEGLRSQISGLGVAQRNANDGISLVQTAEGSLGEVHTILHRLRDLAVQAGNETNNDDSRGAIQDEANQLVDELSRIASSTNFNGIQLLDGTGGNAGQLTLQIGAEGDANSRITLDLSSANIGSVATALTAGSSEYTTFAVADATAVSGVQAFSVNGATISVDLGATPGFTSVSDIANALNANGVFSSTLTASVSNGDLRIVANDGVSQVYGGSTDGTDAAPGTGIGASVNTPGVAGLDFTTTTGAQAAIAAIDTQITYVSTARATLGASQNRLESATRTLANAAENITAAESRIRDTDVSSEVVAQTRASILSQAGIAMLAQANQSGQNVLQLLR